MKTKVSTSQGLFSLSSIFHGDRKAPWSDKNTHNYNNHTITVSLNGKRTKFEFWASIMQPEIQTREQLLDAFSAFVSDAYCGEQSFENFCDELGYDRDSISALRIYKACQRAYKKLSRLTENISALQDNLRELENA